LRIEIDQGLPALRLKVLDMLRLVEHQIIWKWEIGCSRKVWSDQCEKQSVRRFDPGIDDSAGIAMTRSLQNNLHQRFRLKAKAS